MAATYPLHGVPTWRGESARALNLPLLWEPDTHPVAPTTVLIAGSNDLTRRSTALPKRREHRRMALPSSQTLLPCRRTH